MSNTPSAAFSDTKAHYDLLDGLRGVAALMVIWYHIFEGYAFASDTMITTFNHGYLAVDFFFILSGFVIGYAYDDRWGKSLTMKDFFKFTLATVTGIVLSGIVLFIIGVVTLVGIISSSDTETVVKKNSVMMLDLKGTLVERTQESLEGLLGKFTGETADTYGLDDILASIKKAKKDDNIKGIYIQASWLDASYASLQAIRKALDDFKESGKFVVAYSDNYTQGLYYLSSVADKVMLNPKGMIEWRGLASAPIFYKDLLQKLGIEMQVFKVLTSRQWSLSPPQRCLQPTESRLQLSSVLSGIKYWMVFPLHVK